MPLTTDLFDFDLPPKLIAQHPSERRDESRLLVVHRREKRWEHRTFAELGNWVASGDTLFRNNAAVIPARLHASRPTGGAVECLLLTKAQIGQENEWWCLLKPGRKLPVGAKFSHGADFTGTVLEKRSDGTARVGFVTQSGEAIAQVAEKIGSVPLPPYIVRKGTDAERSEDLSRYQTVYADKTKVVAAAAPTAGLHFTPRLLNQLSDRGVNFAEVTLHVGLGTFKPIEVDDITDHPMHREMYEMPVATQEKLFSMSGRRIAVGTTSVRSIEDFLRHHRAPGNAPFVTETDIFIYPPYSFSGVDAMITNFHQPRSTLLCLVAAFLTPGSTDGISFLKEIYADAIAREYRFFSYGDAMLLL